MVLVTGAAGFIGSNLIRRLNELSVNNIIAVDNFSNGDKFINLVDCDFEEYFNKSSLRDKISNNTLQNISIVFHQGACSDTTEKNANYMMENNYRFTLDLFKYCQNKKIPFIYASSASVYGNSIDCIEDNENEMPLNIYAYSKLLFDRFLCKNLSNLKAPAIGLRYFNVYGKNEQHKKKMSSMVFHGVRQFLSQGYIQLFSAYNGYPNGGHKRDFIYIDDIIDINIHFFNNTRYSGIFNCGTGESNQFNEVMCITINSIRKEMGLTSLSLNELIETGLIRYKPFPEDLKGYYQSNTRADISKLRNTGFHNKMKNISLGVSEYASFLYKYFSHQ